VIDNLQADTFDARDYLYTAELVDLPRRVDLRNWAEEIENQQGTNSCTANAGSSACELWTARAGTKKNFSRTFLYWCLRERIEKTGEDRGAYTRDICKTLAETGICEEALWPWEKGVFARPTPEAYTAAQSYRAGRYERIMAYQYRQMKTALALGQPIIVGMSLRTPFRYITGPISTHVAQFNTSDYLRQPIYGQHAMLIVGYDDDAGHWIIENSWGDGWGDQGYVGFPYGIYDYVTLDQWVFTEFAGLKPPAPLIPGITLLERDADTLKARIVPKESELGTETNLWIGLVKDGLIWLKTPAGVFQQYTDTAISAGRVTLTESVEVVIADNVSLAPYAPFDAYVAYGDSPFTWTLAKVAEVRA
jgi:hypothetical protein